MKHLSLSLIALGMAATVGTASAQSLSGQPQYNPGQSTYDDGYGQNAQYEYARVINVVRVSGGGYAANNGYGSSSYGSQGQRCYTRNDGYVDRYGNTQYPDGYRNDGYYGNNGYGGYGGSQTGRTVATVVGGVVGAVLGSQVGGGSARYATSAIGSMVGGQVPDVERCAAGDGAAASPAGDVLPGSVGGVDAGSDDAGVAVVLGCLVLSAHARCPRLAGMRRRAPRRVWCASIRPRRWCA